MSVPMRRRARVLFVAEAVTLAHVARPVALARGLDSGRFEPILAVDPRERDLWDDPAIAVRPIRSIPGAQFREALARGAPLYDAETLRGYVREDLEVIRETSPDVVVGDFRLSLSVSARVAGVPYVAITNAYWSPYARRRFPMPDLPIADRLGLTVASGLFRLARPFAFARHARPLNRVRREYGLPGLGPDLRRIYTDADFTAYADIPELAPTFGRPAHHRYIGPVLWSPDVDRPGWWGEVPDGRPVVYVNLGSSGRADRLPDVLDALDGLDVSVIAATLGRVRPASVPGRRWLADVLPGRDAAARSDLVVCNGGSPATHQALAEGVPVLGLAGNMDQHLNIEGVERLGAGLLLRAGRARTDEIRSAVARLLDEPSFRESARALRSLFARHPCHVTFQGLIGEIVARSGVPGGCA